MSRRAQTFWAGGVLLGCVTVAALLLPALLHGYDSRPAAADGKLIVHEWGTFTSFAGSDGVNLAFPPLVAKDLPRFILGPYSQPDNPFLGLLKDRYVARQRMETPVTYFYTDAPRTVNVRVDFPQGMLTEWYPVVKEFDSGKTEEKRPSGNSFLDWGSVRLIPPEQFADVRVRDEKGQAVPAAFPAVSAEDHYGRARETDSAVIEAVDAKRDSHFEKFLFYRGLGDFTLPLKLVALGQERFEVANSSADASGALLLMRIEKGSVRFTRHDPISPRSVVEITLSSTESTVDELVDATVRELVLAGLYEKEALAMMNTWRTSWFGETGTRLLYLLPEKLTDELLPLSVKPAPQERVRVLVGRLETITPEDCERTRQTLVERYDQERLMNALALGEEGKLLVPLLTGSANETGAPGTMQDELVTLGRFVEPALQFLIGQTSEPQTRRKLETILTDIRSGRYPALNNRLR